MTSAALLDMLAARAAAQENTAVMEMIARMRGQSGAESEQSNQELLAQLGQSNPMMAVLAQQMAERSAAAARHRSTVIEAEAVEIESPADFDDDGALALRSAELAELHARVRAMSNELQTLREMAELLAEALGACCLCWGQDRQCRACHGRGSPGYAMPNEELFEELVLPAVQMLRSRRNKQGVIAPMMPVMNVASGASSGALRHT